MAWTYSQSTGLLSAPDGSAAGTGYAGAGGGLDNPADQAIADVGPIPQGSYKIGAPFNHPQCGPYAMRLEPTPDTNTFGRGGFLMHGDSASMNHTASHGCIIMARTIREAVGTSGDDDLLVAS